MYRGTAIKTVVSLFFLIALLVGGKPASAEWVEWIADGELLYSSRDNIHNGVYYTVKERDQVWTPSVSLGRIYQLTDFSRLILTADVSAASHSKSNSVDYQTYGATLAARHKFGIGPYRPWVRASFSGSRIDSNSTIREGQQYVADVSAGKRVHDRVDLFISYTNDNRTAPNSSSVFDLKGNTLSGGVNFLLTGRILFAVGYSSRSGEIASSCDAYISSLLTSYIKEETPDDAFPGWCAYKADATTTAGTADISYAFYGGHAALNIGYMAAETKVGYYSYENNNMNVSINYSY